MASDKSPDYYPLRWKVADAAEDLFVLHRGKLVAATLLALAALGVAGFFLLEDDSSDDRVETATSDTTGTDATSTTVGAALPDDSTTTSTEAETTDPGDGTTTTTAPTTTTTVEAPDVSPRAPENEAQLLATQPGAIVVMSPVNILLVGGLPSDDVADETLDLAAAVFDDVEVLDEQVVDESFPTPEQIVFRLSAADLFGYNSDVLNPRYAGLIDQLAAAMDVADSWSVEIAGHSDNTGPAPGNQRLSERRAQSAANRLRDGGVSSDRMTVVGYGEDQPIESNDDEAGRLANRRVEFIITR